MKTEKNIIKRNSKKSKQYSLMITDKNVIKEHNTNNNIELKVQLYLFFLKVQPDPYFF